MIILKSYDFHTDLCPDLLLLSLSLPLGSYKGHGSLPSSQTGKPAYDYSNVHWSLYFLPAIWLFYLYVSSPVMPGYLSFILSTSVTVAIVVMAITRLCRSPSH